MITLQGAAGCPGTGQQSQSRQLWGAHTWLCSAPPMRLLSPCTEDADPACDTKPACAPQKNSCRVPFFLLSGSACHKKTRETKCFPASHAPSTYQIFLVRRLINVTEKWDWLPLRRGTNRRDEGLAWSFLAQGELLKDLPSAEKEINVPKSK